MLDHRFTGFRRARACRRLFTAIDRVHRERDPLSHPDLMAMTARELADIPFQGGRA